MGFVWYNGERPTDQNKDAPGFVDGKAIIAISSVAASVGLVLILAIAAYCYRKEVNIKPDKSLLLRHSTSSLPPIKPVVYRVATIGGRSHIFRTESTSLYPQGQHVYQTPKILTTSKQASPRPTSNQYVKRQFNTHPNNGVRILKSPHGPVHMQYKRPLVIYQEPIKPMVAVVPQPNTVPHVRLGAYRPKVIQEYFSPYSIRQYVADQSMDSLQSSSYSTGHGSYVDGEVRHTWYPADREEAYLLQRNEKTVQTKPSREKCKKRSKKSRSTSTDNKYRTKSTQFTEGGTRYTIIDYLVDNTPKQGPLSTSTPRNDTDLHVSLDPRYDLIHEHHRQRRPHDGSLDKMPLLY